MLGGLAAMWENKLHAIEICCPAAQPLNDWQGWSSVTWLPLQFRYASEEKIKRLWRKMFHTMWSTLCLSQHLRLNIEVFKINMLILYISVNRPTSHLRGDNAEEDWTYPSGGGRGGCPAFAHKRKHFQKYTPPINQCKRESVVQKGAVLTKQGLKPHAIFFVHVLRI